MLSRIDISLWSRLRIGTCSWKYGSWKGLVYDVDKSYNAHDYLEDYARYFNTVEIDQWFWSLFGAGAKLPNPTDVERYADSVPDDFHFTVKAPNSITLTHYYAKQAKGSEHLANKPNPHFLDIGLLSRFVDILEPIHDKLGPIMFQFEYLNKNRMPSCQAFLDRLGPFFEKAPTGFSYAVEIRNPKYLDEDLVRFLRSRDVALVLLEGYYMPHIWDITRRLDTRTAPSSIIRLHGPDRAKIEEQTGSIWDRIVAPKNEGLKAVAAMVQDNLDADVDTYVNVNNHYEGCAPLTIERLVDELVETGNR